MKNYKNRSFKTLENSIYNIIKPISNKKKKNFTLLNKIVKNWNIIVGQKYSQFCQPHKITTSNNKTTLFIICYNSSIAFVLDTNQSYIIEKIATYFGYKIISNIKISQTLKAPSKQPTKILHLKEEDKDFITQTTQNIQDSDLKSILEKLGENIFSNKDQKN